jgi:putative methyltransferase (TIGR04325 family)
MRLRRRPATPPEPAPEPLPEWEYVAHGWRHEARGWAVDSVARGYREKWTDYLAAIAPPNPLGVHHETAQVTTGDVGAHNMLLSFAYVVALAAHGNERLSVLDWGGGLGHYYELARSAVPGLELGYHVKETPATCAEGRRVSPGVSFHDDEACLDRRYDLVVASSSLQYAEDWPGLLGRLAGATGRYLYVARVPVALRADSFVVIQRPYVHGYQTEYLGWVVDRAELLERARAAGLGLAREFLLDARFSALGAPEDPVEHRSFLFNR